MSEPAPPTRLNITLPPEQEGGTFANFASVWRDQHGFVVDFAVTTMPAQEVDDGAGGVVSTVPAKIVSRVRIPAGQAIELMKALSAQLDAWESDQGRSRPPG